MSDAFRKKLSLNRLAQQIAFAAMLAHSVACDTAEVGDDDSRTEEEPANGDDDDSDDDGDDDEPGDDDSDPPSNVKADAKAPTPAKDGGTTPPKAVADSGSTNPPTSNPPTANSALWCGARAVLQSRCQTCHGTEPSGASFSLVTYADTQAAGISDKSKKIADLMKVRIRDEKKPMPPVAKGPLTTEERAALDAWIDAGYPNGTCDGPDVTGPKPGGEFAWPAECTPDRIFKIQARQNGQPYSVPADWEDNVAITVPVPWAGKVTGNVQAIAIRPLTNNAKVVHHWILYAGTMQFITSWSPGKEAEAFPADVGVYMPSSGQFRLNMHYYNKGNGAQTDESGAEICLGTKPRPKTATTNMFGPIALTVPPGKSEATTTCTHSGTKPVTIITSSPHMHKSGVRGKFELIRASGMVEMMDDSPFSQEDQSVKAINFVLNPGDKVRTTCVYNNDTSRTKRFGESTDDEMCFNFARYYPMGDLRCGGLGL